LAISFVNKSAFASGTAGLTVGAVSATQANDLILLFVESANQAITTPTGYTIVTGAQASAGTAAAAGGMRLNVFYRWATGADATVSVADTGDHTTAIKLAFRGVDLTTPFDATPTTGTKTTASTSSSYPTITTVTDNAWIVYASALDLDAASTATTSAQANANLTGITERHDQTVASGLGGGIVLTTGVKATAGATGAMTATVTSTQQVYVTLALRVAPVVSTGTFAATETGSDTFAASGTVLVEGALAATETGADTFAGAGPGAVADGVSGLLAATETGSDTFTATGDVIVKGSLAAIESGADTFTATGKVIVKGALAASEAGADTFAATGKVIVKGALAATETGNDTFAATGGPLGPVTGTMAATETGADTFAATGGVRVQGALAATETGQDSFAASGGPVVSGTLAASETGADTFAATGTTIQTSTGVMAAVEAADTFGGYAAGYVDPGYVGGVSGTVGTEFCITGQQAMLLFKIYKLHGLWSEPLVVSASSRTAGDLTQTVTGTGPVTVHTTGGNDTLHGDVGTMIEELAALHGLGVDLVTTATSRTAGAISQTFSTVGNTTTVTRT